MKKMGKLSELTDDKLIQLILEEPENKEAWEEFYNRLSGYLFAIIHHCIAAYHLSKTSIEPYDIFQDVFLTFYEKVLDHNFKFMGDAQLRRYLQVIVRNKVVDSARKLANLPKCISIEAPNSEEVECSSFWEEMIPSEAPCVEDDLILKEKIALLKRAILELKGREKEVMELLLAEHEISEIAYVLGITKNNVRVIRSRAIRKLRKLMLSKC